MWEELPSILRYPNFSKEEFDCSHTGNNEMRPEFLEMLQQLRTEYGKSMKITSGYRDPEHPIERKKKSPGAHTTGLAADIAVDRGEAYEVLRIAMRMGFTGIGVQQKGGGRFLHLDFANHLVPRPTIWSY